MGKDNKLARFVALGVRSLSWVSLGLSAVEIALVGVENPTSTHTEIVFAVLQWFE